MKRVVLLLGFLMLASMLVGLPYESKAGEQEGEYYAFQSLSNLANPPQIPPLQIQIISQANSEGSAIFVSDSITTKDDFGGKVFATPGPASIQHMILADYIATETDFSFELDPGVGSRSDNMVYWTFVNPVQMKNFMLAGNIDGGIAWEPFNTQIVSSVPEAMIYKWTDEIWHGHPCCVVAAKTQFIESNPQAVDRFVASHILATEWIKDALSNPTSDNYTLLIHLAASFSGFTEEIIESSLGFITFDYAINQDWKDALEPLVETYGAMGLFENTLEDIGYDSATEFVNAIVNTQPLENATNVQIVDVDTSLIDVRVGWLAGDLHHLARLVGMNQTIGQELGFGDRSIFQAYGLNIIGGPGNPYANGGTVYTALEADVIDIGYMGVPPAILRTVNHIDPQRLLEEKLEWLGTDPLDGSGTEEDPYVIRNVNELQKVALNPTAHYLLGNDIDASETVDWFDGGGFLPIGAFSGSLNGNGFEIHDLYINRTSMAGLFSQTTDTATIKNVGLRNANIIGNLDFGLELGALVVRNYGDISNSYVIGNISGHSYVGGIVGSNYGNVTNCYAEVGIQAGSLAAGLVGYNQGVIKQSYSDSVVVGTWSEIGGLVGSNNGMIVDSYSIDNVTCQNFIGGLVGSNYGTIERAYTSSEVYGDDKAGGLVGWNEGSVISSYWDVEASEQISSQGGEGRTTDEMSMKATFVDWDFEEIWWIQEGETRPLLRNVVKNAIDIHIEMMPRLDYVPGEMLDLSAMVVVMNWSDGSWVHVSFEDFQSYRLDTSLSNGTALTEVEDHGLIVTVTHATSGLVVDTGALTVIDTLDGESTEGEDEVCAVPFSIMLIFGMTAMAMRRG